MIQYVVVCLIAYLMLRKYPSELRRPQKVQTTVMFGILRTEGYFSCSTGNQDWLLYLVDTFPNSDSDQHSYLLTADPYSDKSSATLDKINFYFLIVLSIFNSTYSAWNSEPVDRF